MAYNYDISDIYENIVDKYLYLGKVIGFFDDALANKFRKELLEYNVIVDNALPGDAVVYSDKKIIKVNMSNFNNKEDFLLTIFHELTHSRSNIHKDIRTDNGYLPILRNHVIDNKSDSGNLENSVNDKDEYILFGGLFIDEVTAEYVATKMVSVLFDKEMKLNNYKKHYGNSNSIYYKSHLDYYSIGEEIVDLFSKTLFGVNNIEDLCKQIFKEDFSMELIRQHNEGNSLSCLINELGLMGMLCLYEEQSWGRYLYKERISDSMLYNSYYDLKDELEEGKEEREKIPRYLKLPDFYN